MYDMIIIGAGTAGLSAAIYGKRAGKTTLLIDGKGFGGQIINTPEVENYPGIKRISGYQFASELYEQATELGAEIKFERVTTIEDIPSSKLVKTETNQYEGKTVILASGAKNRLLGIAQEDKFTGAGVSYCATCDGAFFRGKTVAVIGGGNTALEDAEVLSGIANQVYLIHRGDSFKGEDANLKRLKEKDNVTFLLNSVPEELLGENLISGIKIRDQITDEVKTLEVQGVFVAVGQIPDTSAFIDIVDLNERGYVKAGEDCVTSKKGVFVAGDCREKKVRQLATAASDGAVAALAAVEYVNSL